METSRGIQSARIKEGGGFQVPGAHRIPTNYYNKLFVACIGQTLKPHDLRNGEYPLTLSSALTTARDTTAQGPLGF